MFRKTTAILLLAYLSWAAVGSVFAGEHVHASAEGLLVHRHAPDKTGRSHRDDFYRNRFYHHDRDDRLHEHRHHELPTDQSAKQPNQQEPGADQHHETETDGSQQSGDKSNDDDAEDAQSSLNAPPHSSGSLLASLVQTTTLERPARSCAPPAILTIFTAKASVADALQNPNVFRANRVHDEIHAHQANGYSRDHFARPPPFFV